ncbi:MAG: nucleotide exchange factor GrpE [Legionella sp.]|nr:nucleotide exchange factor GrpE [Legionella sp.]
MSKHGKDWKKFKEENKDEENLSQQDSKDSNLKNENENEVEVEVAAEAALDHASYTELEEKLTLAEQEAFKHKESALRLSAEIENVRIRANKEVTKAHLYGLERFIKELLPVLDSLEQALQLAIKGNDAAMREGLELTMKLFIDGLQKQDVTEINPVGALFDPHEHEAMSMLDQPGTPANTVLVVFQKGYKLNDRVIRPARVIVSKGSSTE